MTTYDTSIGELTVHKRGSGPPIVFVHGFFVSASLWDPVVETFARTHTCLVIEVPFGGHRLAARPGSDLSAGSIADAVASIAGAQGEAVTIVANDTGSVVAELVALRHPEVVRRLVLSSFEAFDNFPPGSAGRAHMFAARASWRSRLLLAAAATWPLSTAVYGPLARSRVPMSTAREWTRAARENPDVLQDFRRATLAIDTAITEDIGRRLSQIMAPTLVLWGEDDRLMPQEHGRRTADAVADGAFATIASSRTLIPYDAPEAFAAAILGWSGMAG